MGVDGTLKITIVECRNIKTKSGGVPSDPLVKIKYSGQKLKTKVVKKTNNPVYNESFRIDMKDKETESILLEVVDHDFARSEALGNATLHMYDLPEMVTIRKTIILKGVDSGEVVAEFKFVPKASQRSQVVGSMLPDTKLFSDKTHMIGAPAHFHLKAIHVWHSPGCINGIQCEWDFGHKSTVGEKHYGDLNKSQIQCMSAVFETDEYVTEVRAKHGSDMFSFLMLETSRGRRHTFGTDLATQQMADYHVPYNMKVVGFSGGVGGCIHNLGLLYDDRPEVDASKELRARRASVKGPIKPENLSAILGTAAPAETGGSASTAPVPSSPGQAASSPTTGDSSTPGGERRRKSVFQKAVGVFKKDDAEMDKEREIIAASLRQSSSSSQPTSTTPTETQPTDQPSSAAAAVAPTTTTANGVSSVEYEAFLKEKEALQSEKEDMQRQRNAFLLEKFETQEALEFIQSKLDSMREEESQFDESFQAFQEEKERFERDKGLFEREREAFEQEKKDWQQKNADFERMRNTLLLEKVETDEAVEFVKQKMEDLRTEQEQLQQERDEFEEEKKRWAAAHK